MTTPKMSASAAAAAQRTQEFCVRWNSHLGSIGAAFPQLLAGQRFVDVTLACEGHQVHCHRLVLAACSSYFESILAENPCKHPVIILPSEIKLWEIQALVDFMYKGEVNVTQAGLPQLLRCAEQLRIRGLYGSDAALNLHQLKALTSKATAAAMDTAAAAASSAASVELSDDTATNSTTTTTNTTAAAASATTSMMHQQQQAQAVAIAHNQLVVKKEPQQQQHQMHHQKIRQTNGAANALQQNHQLQLLQLQQAHKLQQQLQQQQQLDTQAAMMRNTVAATPLSNAPTEDESADDSTSNAYDQYEASASGGIGVTSSSSHLLDSTIEDDHNYVAAAHEADDDDEAGDDSYGHHSAGAATDNELDSSANSSLLLATSMIDQSASFKRVRRSEASLAQAAKCVSKGQTFQTVSNMFNIPVSTIRFYMARKGILPKRKRGRGASTASGVGGGMMSQALAQIKLEPPYHLSGGGDGSGYKLNEAGMI